MRHLFRFALCSAIALIGASGFTACSSDTIDEVTEVNPTYNPTTNEVTTSFAFSVNTGSTGTTRQSVASTQAVTNSGSANYFRGIGEACIQAFKIGTTSGDDFTPADGNYVSGTSQIAVRNYDLGTVLTNGTLNTSTNEASSSHRVLEVTLPLNVNALMFYGRALKTASEDPKNVFGDMTYTITSTGDNANTKFKLGARLNGSGTQRTDMENAEKLIAAIMNRVTETGLIQETTGQKRDLRYAFWWKEGVVTEEKTENIKWDDSELYTGRTLVNRATDPVKGTLYCGSKTWKDYGEQYKNETTRVNMPALDQILGQAFEALTSITDNYSTTTIDGKVYRLIGVRAGSGSACLRSIQDLTRVVNRIRNATPTSPEEYLAQLVANRLYQRIGSYFTEQYFYTNTPQPDKLTFRAISAGSATSEERSTAGLIEQLKYFTEQDYDKPTIIAKIEDFPVSYDLPMGAAQLVYGQENTTDDPHFYYKSEAMSLGIGAATTDAQGNDVGPTTNVTKIMYPAELCYFGNSPVRTADQSLEPADYPNGTTNWDTPEQWERIEQTNAAGVVTQTGFSFQANSHVQSSTRSVAMQKDIQYGSALLATTVKISKPTLKDNRSALFPGENDNEINGAAGQFKLTGVLIGGQYGEFGWDYLPVSGATDDYVIYDKAVGEANSDGKTYAGISIPAYAASAGTGEASSPNYTLVMDNYKAGTYADVTEANSKQSPVYVALELENNGDDFWGTTNLVRAGGKFYLVGKLDPTTITDADKKAKFPEAPTTEGGDTGGSYHPVPPYKVTGNKVETFPVQRVFIQDYITHANFVINENSLKTAFVTVPDLRTTEMSLGLSVNLEWSKGMTFDDVVLGQ